MSPTHAPRETAPSAVLDSPPPSAVPAPAVYAACLLVGLGGLFNGVTGPLVSAFVPPLVADALGDQRVAIGAVMAIDNVLLLLLVPWAGAASDRAAAARPGPPDARVAGFVLGGGGDGADAFFRRVRHWRRDRRDRGAEHRHEPAARAGPGAGGRPRAVAPSLAGHRVGDVPDVRRRDRVPDARADIRDAPGVPDGGGHRAGRLPRHLRWGLREPAVSESHADEATFRAVLEAAWSAVRGTVPGMRAIFVAALLLQLTFQTFTTWYALHGTERFGVRPEDVTIGLIAWAVGGVFGAVPAGFLGMRIGRRNAMLLGFALMAVCLVALDRVTMRARPRRCWPWHRPVGRCRR